MLAAIREVLDATLEYTVGVECRFRNAAERLSGSGLERDRSQGRLGSRQGSLPQLLSALRVMPLVRQPQDEEQLS